MIISKRCVMAVMPFCYDFQPSNYSIYVEKILYIKADLSIPTHHPFNVSLPCGKDDYAPLNILPLSLTPYLKQASNPFLMTCASKTEQSRKALVLCMIFCPVAAAAAIRKSCKNPRRDCNRPLPLGNGRISRKTLRVFRESEANNDPPA